MPLHSELLLKWTALLKSMILRLLSPTVVKSNNGTMLNDMGNLKKGQI